uniref:Divalent-cation tolerance protein CutA n=1 Tax=Desulfacinum infernum TaxID=35837 RepID=A0A832A6X6_9BACT
MASDVLITFITVGNPDQAYRIAKAVVEENLAACVNIIPAVRSLYRWKGEICDDSECLLLVKTTSHVFPLLEARVKALHSYEVPEIIAVPVACGFRPYLDWVAENTHTQKP